ncbi:aminotransferase class I/II-fold pyridoxal phosphate-dependent enzyme [Pseudonocardia sp. NPDC046786]|uniref:aminotransferase class I/II-fold pyridoxal phosphate-dependent enzyme n=1 Tax=Pseudonocardia sp. NPDC046786 TaxID=3155471 RepID=UPI0033DF8A13
MIDDELDRLLGPLERFETVRRRVARLGNRACDLSYANFAGGVEPDALGVLRRALDDDRALGMQYAPFGGQTLARRAVADDLRVGQGLPTTYADVILTPGAMAGLQLALRVAGVAGDEVVVPVPCWLDHPLYVQSLGMTVRPVPMRTDDFALDLDAIGAAFGERTSAVLLSNPNNPTGTVVTPQLAEGLRDLIVAHERRTGRRITVIADETHRDFCPDGLFTSIASTVARTLIVYSFGKRHFMQGQRLGYVAVSPAHPERAETGAELVRWTRITGTATPTAVMQRAVHGLLKIPLHTEALHRARARLRAELEGLGFTLVPSESTLFLYLRTPDGLTDAAFAERLASDGVLVLPAECFHHEGYVRLAVTGDDTVLERAVQVFRRHAPADVTTGAVA